MDTTATLPAGRAPLLGRYRPVRLLGTGGFGTVWLAQDERLGRPVAVKVVPLKLTGTRGWREAMAAARLSHPAIVALHEAVRDDEAAYLVSEWVRGVPLSELLEERALSDLDVVEIGLALAGALEHAHERGVVHRDVKPANVLVPEDGRPGAAVAKLTDFGVAHVAGGDPLTATGDVLGTLAYMAPEQAEGRRVTPAADVYALALVIFEGLTGENPVRAESPAATARRLGSPLPPLLSRRPDLPPALAYALDGALEPDPELRTELPELRVALGAARREVADEPGWAREEDEPLPARRAVPALAARLAAAGTAGALAGLGAYSVHQAAALPALVVALAVLLLPRLGWLAASAFATAWLAFELHRAGDALVLLSALVAVPLVLPRRGTSWSVPAAAPLLAAAGLAGAYCALVSCAATPLRRALLGGLGAWGVLSATRLDGTAWPSSLAAAGPEVALVVLWALAAAALAPVAAREPVLGPLAWAAALTAATQALHPVSLPLFAASAALTALATGPLAWRRVDRRAV